MRIQLRPAPKPGPAPAHKLARAERALAQVPEERVPAGIDDAARAAVLRRRHTVGGVLRVLVLVGLPVAQQAALGGEGLAVLGAVEAVGGADVGVEGGGGGGGPAPTPVGAAGVC
jgi:hypothetical protein